MSLYLALNLRCACLPSASRADCILHILKYTGVQPVSDAQAAWLCWGVLWVNGAALQGQPQ